MDYRPILMVVGLLVAVLALVMCIPAVVDYVNGYKDWQVFATSASVTLFVGIAMALTGNTGSNSFSVRQAFVITSFSWIALTLFASLPFAFSELNLSFTDSFFEAMSGLTTTGSTVIVGLDRAPPGILLWRSLLQWLGGIGIIVMAIAVLPMLQVGGMQLFRMESSEPFQKALPRAAQIASATGVIYLGLTIIWTALYWLLGMSGFDALTHSMTTIATGGFSTHDSSMAYFKSSAIHYAATCGMVLGALPFVLYLKTLSGNWTSLVRDSQVQWFITFVLGIIAAMTIWLSLIDNRSLEEVIRLSAFNVVSIVTGTGYVSANYSLWGAFALPVFFFIMFVGGCAGSTTCGVKIFRFQILYSATRAQIRRLTHPHGVFIPTYNGRPVSQEVIVSVLSFFFMWFFSFSVLALGLGALGLDFLTAFSSAASAIANVGPALGSIAGPSGTFQPLPDSAKWLLSWGMLLGRLELFTVIVLFSRNFWKG
ncbi:MAG: potassium transporter TrkH [Magnetovibrio sp.]|nr:potassium transporter TrkH [Magnetovibrio sp.]